MAKRKRTKSQKDSHDRPVIEMLISELFPSPENDQLYRPVDPDDPEIQELAKSIRKRGVMDLLVVSEENFIISGHRRFCAAKIAGLKKVPVRVEPIRRTDDINKFVAMLRECNLQRDKTLAEKLREEIVSTDPSEAYYSMIEHREESSKVEVSTIQLQAVSKLQKCN